MRDQPALRVDHIGLPVLADLDARDHFPDQLEIDLGHAHAGIAPGAGERERHVGLGLAAEIDRAVVDLLGHGLGEFRIAGEVGLARHHVHGEPRHLELLAAGGVELGQFGDGRHLAQQAQAVETPRLDRARRPRQLGGPADLALDPLDELVDFLRGRGRLLALDADQRGLVLPIGEHDFERAVGDQRDDHTTAMKSATYLRNSGPLICRQPTFSTACVPVSPRGALIQSPSRPCQPAIALPHTISRSRPICSLVLG